MTGTYEAAFSVIFGAAGMRGAVASSVNEAGTSGLPEQQRRNTSSSNRDGNSEVNRMKADGSGQTRLTDTETLNFEAQWSPDGKKIVFISFEQSRFVDSEIYKMDADGLGEVNLADDTALDSAPSWFPSGDKLSYSSHWTSDGSGYNDVYALVSGSSGSTTGPLRLTKIPNAEEYARAVSPTARG